MIRSFAIAFTSLLLGLTAVACAPDSEDLESADELRAVELWESIDGYRSWHPVPHGQEVEIHAQDLSSIDGMNLSGEVAEGNLVVCEQYERGQLRVIEAFERVDHGERRWYSARFTPDGELLNERFRAEAEPDPKPPIPPVPPVLFQCGDCHTGGIGGGG